MIPVIKLYLCTNCWLVNPRCCKTDVYFILVDQAAFLIVGAFKLGLMQDFKLGAEMELKTERRNFSG